MVTYETVYQTLWYRSNYQSLSKQLPVIINNEYVTKCTMHFVLTTRKRVYAC